MKFAFVAKHRGIWPVRWMCEALGVSRSGFHAWLTRAEQAGRSDERRAGAASSPATEPTGLPGLACWRRASHAAAKINAYGPSFRVLDGAG
jgi:hypothetical protein